MLMACTVAHRFSIVTVLPRVKPLLEDVVRLHGLESRCASIRTTPLSVLDCERDPTAAEREIVKAARAAIDEDGAEAICLGCAGMGPLDKAVQAEIGVPVLDGVACAVKLRRGHRRLRPRRRAGSPPTRSPSRRSSSTTRAARCLRELREVAVAESDWLERAKRHCFRGRLDGADVGGPVFVRGSGSLVWDVEGKSYLDFNAGQMCSTLGHCHPRVVAAVAEQLRTLIHSSSTFHNTREVELAERLAGTLPPPLRKCLFGALGLRRERGRARDGEGGDGPLRGREPACRVPRPERHATPADLRLRPHARSLPAPRAATRCSRRTACAARSAAPFRSASSPVSTAAWSCSTQRPRTAWPRSSRSRSSRRAA